MEKKYKLTIVDDHNIIIDGLVMLLGFEKNIEIGKTYNDGYQLIDDLRSGAENPDMVLLDLMMPKLNGLQCSRLLKQEFPHLKILILSMNCDAKVINELINKIGVEGYLNKSVSRKELVEGISLIRNGYIHLSQEASQCLDNYREKLIQNDHINLSIREKEIVHLMISGNSNREIAAKLFISESTVETHRKNIYRKTDTHSLPKLIQMVHDLNLLEST
ncbi:response regulator transcription factor [Chryseobacterium suipulveris]|uniref:Response regulator transcription factor n=1 Tax=Chryseobacterium suipulveris TaxID=2929800 RepID=A0ABY4BPW9_9FLAO|nr:response regulator transcription factor [Chryseobacterium suipulveris]UOE39841.1 response regulator transcription factor [Chryseobacterium suipulveris]